VSIPDYLERSQIVTGVGTDRVEFLMLHRWAEPLENAITRILAEEIGARVPIERIVTYPWRDMVARAMRCQVVVAVVRFDGHPGGDVTLGTRWQILGRDGDELALERSTVIQAAMGPSVEDLVAGMGRALATLGREIAVEVRHGCMAERATSGGEPLTRPRVWSEFREPFVTDPFRDCHVSVSRRE